MHRNYSTACDHNGKIAQMTVAACVVALLVITAISVAACGSSSSAANTGSQGEPKVLVVGCDGPPYTTYNALDEGVYYALEDNVYERLCGWDSKAHKTIPQIAEKWEASKDYKKWTFYIRKNTKFHDGSDLDANAVKDSIMMIKERGSQTVYTDAIANMECPDKYTLVMNLKWPQQMDMSSTTLAGGVIVSPAGLKKYGEDAFTPGHDLGSGPYKLVAATTSEIRLERYEDYYLGWTGDKGKAPNVAVFRGIDEPAARTQNLEQGDIQVALGLLPEDAARLQETGEFDVWYTDGWSLCTYELNTKKAPLDDQYVREAIFWAYPYEQAVQLALKGKGTVGCGPIAPGDIGYEQQLERFGLYKQDMQKAKAALAKSKYPDGGITIDCPVETGKAWEMKAAQLWKAALSQLNIKLNCYLQSAGVTLERAWSDDPPQNMVAGDWMKTSSLPYELHYTQITDLCPMWNLCYWSSPEVTKLVKEGVSLMPSNRQKAVDKLNDAWQIALDNHTVMYTFSPKRISASAKSISGFQGSEPGTQNTVNCYNISMN